MADKRAEKESKGVFDERAKGPCPCGGTYYLGYSDGDEKTGRPMVMHSMPECSDFHSREFFDYLEWARAGHKN